MNQSDTAVSFLPFFPHQHPNRRDQRKKGGDWKKRPPGFFRRHVTNSSYKRALG